MVTSYILNVQPRQFICKGDNCSCHTGYIHSLMLTFTWYSLICFSQLTLKLFWICPKHKHSQLISSSHYYGTFEIGSVFFRLLESHSFDHSYCGVRFLLQINFVFFTQQELFHDFPINSSFTPTVGNSSVFQFRERIP